MKYSILFFLISLNIKLQGQHLQWVNTHQSPGSEYAQATVFDTYGNVWVAGHFENLAQLSSTDGNNLSLTSLGGSDNYLAKYDAQGVLLWAGTIGGTGNDAVLTVAVSLATDALGNIYWYGNFNGTNVDMDPGPGTSLASSISGNDLFFSKLDNNGNLIWVRTLDALSSERNTGIAIDASNNVYIGGSFMGSNVDFDAGAGTDLRSGTGALSNIFFTKYDQNGNYQWANTFGSALQGTVNVLRIDASGNVLVGGYFDGTFDADPGAGTSLQTANPAALYDFYFAKYDNNGNYQWFNHAGGVADNNLYALDTDASGNVYIGGYLTGSAIDVDFGPGITSVSTSASGADAYLAKYDANGQYIFFHLLGDNGTESVLNLIIDSQNNINLIGLLYNSLNPVDLDPGSGYYPIIGSSSFDMFVAQYDGNGALQWANSYIGNNDEFGGYLINDNYGNLYLCGYYTSTNLDIDAESGTILLPHSGAQDAFLCKISICPKITILSQPNKVRVDEDKELKITISAQGNDLVYQWQKNGIPLVVTDGFTGIASAELSKSVTSLSDAGTYTCLMTDSCLNQFKTAIIEVEVIPEVKIFEYITPNNDGKNDFWEVKNIDKFSNYTITIFNRWGNSVFESSDYNNDWNGSHLPEGNYYYLVKIEDIDVTLKGGLLIQK